MQMTGHVYKRSYLILVYHILVLLSLTHSSFPLLPFLPTFPPGSLNTYQYTRLTTYVRTIYASPLLEYVVVKNFIKALPPGEVASANEVEDWSR
jgi:hypothetical protein